MKNLLVTGCSGGIGQSIVQHFKKEGWFVIGTDIKDSNHCDVFIQCDLQNPVDIPNISKHLNKENVKTLHGLVNNAAIQIIKKIEDVTPEDWYRTLSINLISPYMLIQSLIPFLKGNGHIVNISSIHANLTKKYFSLYASSKGGLNTMTKSLALELAPDIRINAILPAATLTKMLEEGFQDNPEQLKLLAECHPLNRLAQPVEIAKAVQYLLSDESSFMTGSLLEINGGIGSLLHDPSLYQR